MEFGGWTPTARNRPLRLSRHRVLDRRDMSMPDMPIVTELILAGAACYAVILAASALGKFDAWGAWTGFTARLSDGAPRGLQQTLTVAVPILEIGSAYVLVVSPRHGLQIAAVLFLCFAAVPAARYSRLRGQDCACFGVAHQTEIGWILIARNTVLAAFALGLGISVGHGVGHVPFLAVASAALGLLTLLVTLRLRKDLQTFSALFGKSLITGRSEKA
jgi:Methylamine utilisation protein MauE